MLNEDEIAGRVAMEIVAKNAREKGVMAIQRYEVRGNNYGEFPSSTGKFVLYADHESECRERERRAYMIGREAESMLGAKAGRPHFYEEIEADARLLYPEQLDAALDDARRVK